jgi:molybdenum cofactor biosynthesis protein B
MEKKHEHEHRQEHRPAHTERHVPAVSKAPPCEQDEVPSHEVHRQEAKEQYDSIACGILTISDTRTLADDKSGQLVQEMLKEAGHAVVSYTLVKNDPEQIRQALFRMVASPAQFIICIGGTGLSSKDITIETVQPLLEKELPGYGELFRWLSYEEIGTATIMSRALAGKIGNKIIVCNPGSSGAIRLAMSKIIIPELAHMLREASR